MWSEWLQIVLQKSSNQDYFIVSKTQSWMGA